MGNRSGSSRKKRSSGNEILSSYNKKLDRNKRNKGHYTIESSSNNRQSDLMGMNISNHFKESFLTNSYLDQQEGNLQNGSRGRPVSSTPVNRTGMNTTNSNKLIYVANYDFNGSMATDELSFRRGDKLEIFDKKTYKDWWRAINLETQLVGYVPSNYISPLDDLTICDWFFAETTRRDAERFLEQPHNGQGVFLVRPSDSNQNQYALSVLDLSREKHFHVKHYRVRQDDQGLLFISEKHFFPSLPQLIEYYRTHQDGLCCLLTSPCRRIEPIIPIDRHGLLELDRKELIQEVLLGKGNYGEVFRGKYGQRTVAIKLMKTDSKNRFSNVEKFLDEAKIMKDLLHKNIVRLYGVCTEEEPIFIVTEFMTHGCLLIYLRQDQGQLIKFKHILDYAAQIANGMAFLEQKRYVHCDLAARNVLVGEFNVVKIADFGLAKILQGDRLQIDRETQFPIKWTAPEAATKKEYTTKSDVWSFGILLYELITYGANPYPGMSNNEALQAVLRGYRMPKQNDFHPFYYQVMCSCWDENPDDRPTFESLYSSFDNFFSHAEPSYREG